MSKFNDLCTCISDLQTMIDRIDGTDFGKLESLFDEMKKTADKAANLSELFDAELDLTAMPELVEALTNARDRIEIMRDPEAHGPWGDRLKREIDDALAQATGK